MPEISANNKRIAKNTLMLYFRMLFLMAVNLYTSRVVLSALGVEDFGIYNIVGGVITAFTFISSAMRAATQRFLNFSMGKRDDEELRRVFNASQVIHFCFAIIVVVLVETIGLWFIDNKLVIPEPRMDAAVMAFHCSVIATAFLIISYPYNAVIIAREKMGVFAYVSIFEGVAKLIIAFAIGWASFDRLVFYAVLLMSLQILVSLIYRIYCLRHFNETKFKISDITRKLYKEILSFSGWNVLGNIANVCLIQGTNILLNMFFGPAVNAAKGISVQVQHTVNQFCTNFQVAQNPQIVKSYAENDFNYMHSLIFRASRFSFYLSLIFTLPIMMRADWALAIWLKNVPDYAPTFVGYTMCFNLIQSLANPLLTGSMATGNVKKIMLVIALFFWSIIPLCYIALRAGASPVAVFQIQLILYIVAHIMRINIVGKQINFSRMVYAKEVIYPIVKVSFLAFGVAALLSKFFTTDKIGITLLFLVIISIINVGFIWFAGMKRNERTAIMHFIKSKIFKNI